MTKVPFVHSNYPRIAGDNYQTIDKRCIYGFLEHFTPQGLCIDVCSPNGSGIVTTLTECGYNAVEYGDALTSKNLHAEWIVTNPPYTRGLVDEIITRQIDRIRIGNIQKLAILLRSNFDFAKGRISLFENKYYYGQIKLRFRPWWSEDRKAQPIHNYIWHIWMAETDLPPIIMYADGIKPMVSEDEKVETVNP